jgi:hypothetical protein
MVDCQEWFAALEKGAVDTLVNPMPLQSTQQ